MKALAIIIAAVASAAPLLPAQTQSPAPAQSPSPAASPSIPPDSPKYGVYPVGYQAIITRWLDERLTDPASKQVEFGQPAPAEVTQKNVRASGYRVEFRVNSRNRFGTYTGFQRHQVLIRNGEIVWADRVRN